MKRQAVIKETLSGMRWMLLQKCTQQPVALLYAMVLSRHVSAAEMGLLGLTAVFFTAATSLQHAGIGSVLVRRQRYSDADLNTMFWFNLVMGGLLAGGIVLAAPGVAAFFSLPELELLAQAAALIVFLSCAASVHISFYTSRRQFRIPALVCTGSTLAGLPVCLLLAQQGWGIWAYMVQGIVGAVLTLFVFFLLCPWKPAWCFSGESLRKLGGMGCRLASTGMLDTLYIHTRAFFIGKFYSASGLGVYKNGAQLAAMLPTILCYMLDQVTFPVLSTLRSTPGKMRTLYRRYMRAFTLGIAWVCIFTAVFAESLVELVYGPGWQEAVPYLQILSLSYATWHLQILNLNLLKAGGPKELFLRLEIAKKLVGTVILVAMFPISMLAICYGALATSIINLTINTCVTARVMHLPVRAQLRDFLPQFALAGVACLLPRVLVCYAPVPGSPWLHAGLGFCVSLILYPLLLGFFRSRALRELRSIWGC